MTCPVRPNDASSFHGALPDSVTQASVRYDTLRTHRILHLPPPNCLQLQNLSSSSALHLFSSTPALWHDVDIVLHSRVRAALRTYHCWRPYLVVCTPHAYMRVP